MSIKVVVLKSGEDVIADIKEMVSPDQKVIGYFLTKPCVMKLHNTDNMTPEELDPKKPEKKSEFSVTMYPWMPMAKETSIPLSTDWVVTMVTPIDKIYQMYEEDILKNGKESSKSNSVADESETDQ